ncbi:MAG: methylamine utilization protein [Betaproteobacteria bacterium]|nr:methylamine utilization protein [Betaproteobacteria bacterium]
MALTLALMLPCMATAAQLAAQVTNSAGQPVADVVVHATLLSGAAPARPKKEISIEQVNKEFVPLVSVAQTGTLVNFPNRDQIRHHVYSFSPAKTFEIKLYSGVPTKPLLFDKPGEVVLGCNIHDTMIAYVLIVDTPFFAKTDKQGRGVLDNLPAGDYEVQMWYPGGTAPASQKVRLGASENADLKFAFTPRPSGPRPPPGK